MRRMKTAALLKYFLTTLLLVAFSAPMLAADFTYTTDDDALAVLNRLERELIAASHLKTTPHIGILDYPEVNAFATGSQQIFVTRNLLRAVTTEDELAAVLAHELGHLTRKIPNEETRSFAAVDANETRADQIGMKLLTHVQIDPRSLFVVLERVSTAWGNTLPASQRKQLDRRIRWVAHKAHVDLRTEPKVS